MKNVLRQTHLSGHGRRENDAEHAWHMALMTYLLREYSNEPIDVSKAMIMVLIHDMVEIDAGDTYAYDKNGHTSKKEREAIAAERIFGLLPEDQKKELYALFEEFELGETAEARFARAMDNFQPLLLNHSNGGSDWKDRGININQVMGRHCNTKFGSAEIWDYAKVIIDEHFEQRTIEKE